MFEEASSSEEFKMEWLILQMLDMDHKAIRHMEEHKVITRVEIMTVDYDPNDDGVPFCV